MVCAVAVSATIVLPQIGGIYETAGAGPSKVLAHPSTTSYSTGDLVARAAELEAAGWSEDRINRAVYAPFIIAGNASWSDTWGAPRSGPAPGQVRTHEGQDVFCDYGDPVLASEAGTVSLDNGGLGGYVTRLHRSDGSYWYYAHLSSWPSGLASGQSVRAGDVIGYCGTSGNAATTPPHVHFGWYSASGSSLDPMDSLVSWLRTAEGRKAPVPDPVKTTKPRKAKAERMDDGTQGTLELSIGTTTKGRKNGAPKQPAPRTKRDKGR